MAIKRDETKALFQKANLNVREEGVGLPLGTYFCKLIQCKLGENKNKIPMVTTVWEVLQGEYKGKKHYVWNNISDEYDGVSVTILFGVWRKFGYDTSVINTLDDIQEHCEDITSSNIHANIRIVANKKNPEYNNTYVDKVIKMESAPSEPVVKSPELKTVEIPDPLPEHNDDIPGFSDEKDSKDDDEQELEVGDTIEFIKNRKSMQGVVALFNVNDNSVTLTDQTIVKLSEIQKIVNK